MFPPHHHLTNSLASSLTEYASSTTSSRASSPRTQPHHSVVPFQDDDDEDDSLSRPSSEDLRSSTYSDSYESSQEGHSARGSTRRSTSRFREAENPLIRSSHTSSTTSSQDGVAPFTGAATTNNLAVLDHQLWSDSSRVSSRAASPVPGLVSAGGGGGGGDGFDGYLAYRAGSAATGAARLGGVARSRSGFSTPTTPAELEEEKDAYDTEYEADHPHQTSALLDKLSGAFTPDTSPIIGRKSRKPGWWSSTSSSRRVESSRRKNTLSSSSFGSHAPLLGTPSGHYRPVRKSHHRETLSASSSSSSLSHHSSSNSPTSRIMRLVHLFLRQPYVPTQPITILFSILLFLCFAATLTTFLLNVLSSDREPLPWRQFCQEQRPFPHALADSLKPVSVFVGIFSVDAAVDRRNAIRLSYAKHSLPIDPRTGRPGQNVQVKFVLGKPREKWSKRIALEMEMFNDIVVLDVGENMNKGKTFAFFNWAHENATVPVYYTTTTPHDEGDVGGSISSRKQQVGVGFKKADYVVKADDDSFIVLSELERHLRLTPRENTYWGYLIRNRFMGGEVYALSSDLVTYLATYPRPASWTVGKEDQRVAKWMRNHPNASSIHWITERCYIYDHPKAGTTYARGFTFPDHVEQVRLEGRRGISEQERLRRGGELWQTYSTVQQWKKPYVVPAEGLSIEEQVEALVEGGGRWNDQGYRSDNGRGPHAIRYDALVFDRADDRLVSSPRFGGGGGGPTDSENDSVPDPTTLTEVRPGVPDINDSLPSARTTRFGKDLFRDPEGVAAVQLRKRAAGGIQEGPTRAPLGEGEYEIFNLARGPFEDEQGGSHHSTNFVDPAGLGVAPKTTLSPTWNPTSSVSAPPSSSSSSSSSPLSGNSSSSARNNEPTGQIRLGHHAYTVPYTEERFIPAPSLRYDPSSLSLRSRRMLGLPHGGTVAVHYLKRNEWFYETALALLGREKMWDSGFDSPAFPYDHDHHDHPESASVSTMEDYALGSMTTPSSASAVGVAPYEKVQVLPALWGGVRMYGSPIVLEDGTIVQGRRAEAHREIQPLLSSPPGRNRKQNNEPVVVEGGGGGGSGVGWASRFAGGGRTMGMMALAEMEGVEIKVGDRTQEEEEEEEEEEKEVAKSLDTVVPTVEEPKEDEIDQTSSIDSTTTTTTSEPLLSSTSLP